MWQVVTLLVMLGVLLLVVVVALVKYIQLHRLQQALEQAWFSRGVCTGEDQSNTCRLYADVDVQPPTDAALALPRTFSFSMATSAADYVSRVELLGADDEIPLCPPGHRLVHLLQPRSGPAFGALWKVGHTLVVALRATVTHSEVQDDLMAWQVDWTTGERLRVPLRTQARTRRDIDGAQPAVHSGFYQVYARFRHEVLQAVADDTDLKHVLVTGHSLGGAVATLLCLDMGQRLQALELRHVKHVVGIVFGTPRVGNESLARTLQELPQATLWRVMNQCDIIASLPPHTTPNFKYPQEEMAYYTHVGRPHLFDDNRGSWQANHQMAVYRNHVSGGV